jgi:hypothetical protein
VNGFRLHDVLRDVRQKCRVARAQKAIGRPPTSRYQTAQ